MADENKGDKKIEELKNKIRKAKEDLEVKKNELTRLHREEIELIGSGLDTDEKTEKFRKLNETRELLLKRIKSEVEELKGLLEELSDAERSFLGWVLYILIWPFRKLFELIRGLFKAIDELDAEKVEKLLEKLLAEVAKKI